MDQINTSNDLAMVLTCKYSIAGSFRLENQRDNMYKECHHAFIGVIEHFRGIG